MAKFAVRRPLFTCVNSFIPSYASLPLQSSPSRTRHGDCHGAFHGVRVALFATSPDGVLATGFPRPTAFPPTAFLTPSTACSAIRLAGLFRPAATYRVPLFRGLSLMHRGAFSSKELCPLVVVGATLTCVTTRRRIAPTRPQGFVRCMNPRPDVPTVKLPRLLVPLVSFPSSRSSALAGGHRLHDDHRSWPSRALVRDPAALTSSDTPIKP